MGRRQILTTVSDIYDARAACRIAIKRAMSLPARDQGAGGWRAITLDGLVGGRTWCRSVEAACVVITLRGHRALIN